MQNHPEKMSPELANTLADLSNSSMDFHKRRQIYRDLNTNPFTQGLGANYDYIIPHYLMYSTIGRADLIRFQSFMETALSGVLPQEVLKALEQS